MFFSGNRRNKKKQITWGFSLSLCFISDQGLPVFFHLPFLCQYHIQHDSVYFFNVSITRQANGFNLVNPPYIYIPFTYFKDSKAKKLRYWMIHLSIECKC